jgi:hypothetical protein
MIHFETLLAHIFPEETTGMVVYLVGANTLVVKHTCPRGKVRTVRKVPITLSRLTTPTSGIGTWNISIMLRVGSLFVQWRPSGNEGRTPLISHTLRVGPSHCPILNQ